MNSNNNYTLDGSEELETRIADLCEKAARGIAAIVPSKRIEAVLLGGGYGRGEGGVLHHKGRDLPYNDLEFFVFLKGHPFLNERRYQTAIHALAQRLTKEAGIDVEFKITSAKSLRRSRPTMFFYDLFHGHQRILGDADVFGRASQHSNARNLPLAESTRLLMNRCSGLLFARNRLNRGFLTSDDVDFIQRNVAKAQLAMGDAILAASGEYHWSCIERRARLEESAENLDLPFIGDVLQNHGRGVAFKLRPQCIWKHREQLELSLKKNTKLAWQVWRWLEDTRLGEQAGFPEDYAQARSSRCPEVGFVRVLLANIKTFGLSPIKFLAGYPRARLLRSLPLLLWRNRPGARISNLPFLQKQLATEAADFGGLLNAYSRLWTRYN